MRRSFRVILCFFDSMWCLAIEAPMVLNDPAQVSLLLVVRFLYMLRCYIYSEIVLIPLM